MFFVISVFSLSVFLPSHQAGNVLAGRVCRAHGKDEYCWQETRPWSLPFWRGHGAEVGRGLRLPEAPSHEAIVHIRCGDIMIKEQIPDARVWSRARYPRTYLMPCASCVAANAKWLGRKAILIVGGHMADHFSKSHTDTMRGAEVAEAASRCQEYTKLYTGALNGAGVEIERQRHGAWDDFALLRKAKRVLAIVPSSFVFAAKANRLDSLRMIAPFNHSAPWWYDCPGGFTHNENVRARVC